MNGIELLVAFALGAAVMLWLVWSQQRNKSDVLFFPDDKMPCYSFYNYLNGKRSICRRDNCQYAHYTGYNTTSLMEIFLTLKRATHAIDLCIFDFTQNNLADYLISASARGIRVRIITDAHFDRQQTGESSSNDQIPRLQKAGIPIKINKSNSKDAPLMHNKFVIIDRRYLLMGSFNWTHKAVLRNHEAIIRTELNEIVGQFSAKFDQMWRHLENRPGSSNDSPNHSFLPYNWISKIMP